MKFAVLFEDDPATRSDVRSKHMPAHLSFLEKHATTVLAAGPLRTSDGHGAGGLWLVEAGDASEIEALVKVDPFWPTGLRKSVRIFEWNQVFADGRRLIPG
jgi:uncharacterized protein YciI